MNHHPMIKYLCLVTALAVSGCALESQSLKRLQAPVASAEEAKITQWTVPDSERNFWDIAELEQAFITTAPRDLNDGIATTIDK